MIINQISNEVICNHMPHTNCYIHNLHSKYLNIAYIELFTNDAFRFTKKKSIMEKFRSLSMLVKETIYVYEIFHSKIEDL